MSQSEAWIVVGLTVVWIATFSYFMVRGRAWKEAAWVASVAVCFVPVFAWVMVAFVTIFDVR